MTVVAYSPFEADSCDCHVGPIPDISQNCNFISIGECQIGDLDQLSELGGIIFTES